MVPEGEMVIEAASHGHGGGGARGQGYRVALERLPGDQGTRVLKLAEGVCVRQGEPQGRGWHCSHPTFWKVRGTDAVTVR